MTNVPKRAAAGPGVVVVGTGFGCVTHVRALRNAGFEVRALVGRDPRRTAERARLFGVPLALTDLAEALSLPGVDAATIATPPHTHAAITLAAIGAGKHVLCEKPLARDAAQAHELLAAAEAASVVHLLGTEFRFDTGQALLARVVARGDIGVPRLMTALMYVPSLVGDAGAEVPAWWADVDSDGGWLVAHGSQVIDQVRATCGEVASVSASRVSVGGHAMTADDGFLVELRLTSGAVAVLASTASDRGWPVIETRVAGSEGTAWIAGIGADVFVADARGTRQIAVPDDLVTPPPEPPPSDALQTAYDRMVGHGFDLGPYTRLAAAFRDRILGLPPAPGPQPATFADGVTDMAVLDAARASAAAGGAWVDV